jgi:TetR/AcrR family transcriptional regulator, tetracycline repressor protein
MTSEPVRDEPDRARLSKHAVVSRALTLADTEGLNALTIRRLAAELGVTPMALYWHFRSKEELLKGLSDQVWSEIDVDVDAAAPWSQQLRGLLESLVSVLRAHPSAPHLVLDHEKNSPAAIKATEITLEVLRGAGFGPAHASEIARGTLWQGLMLVMSESGLESGTGPPLPAVERAECLRANHVRLATLPIGTYPRVVECALPMTSTDPELHYRFGIDLFIAGVEAMAMARADARPSGLGPANHEIKFVDPA